MKKIGILSDTHSFWDDKFEYYFNECDEIWHAGDIGDITILERLREICPVVRAVLTSSMRTPKFISEHRDNALMTFHQHCFSQYLLVLR